MMSCVNFWIIVLAMADQIAKSGEEEGQAKVDDHIFESIKAVRLE